MRISRKIEDFMKIKALQSWETCSAFKNVVTFLTLVTTDTVSGMFHLVSRCPAQVIANRMP